MLHRHYRQSPHPQYLLILLQSIPSLNIMSQFISYVGNLVTLDQVLSKYPQQCARYLVCRGTDVPAVSTTWNKYIGDDTKAAVCQSLNCIKNKNKIKYGEFSICRMEFLHPAMWHNHDIDFVRWLHPAMWHVALESWLWIHQVAAPCNVIRGSGMICHWIRPNVRHIGILHLVSISTHHRSRHVILYQSAKF